MSAWSLVPPAASRAATAFVGPHGVVTQAVLLEETLRAAERLACGERPTWSPRSAGAAELAALLGAAWRRGARALLGPTLVEIAAAAGAAAAGGASSEIPDERVLAELVTSGTTGTPERHEKRARQLFGEAQTLARLFELGEADVVLCTAPLHHLYSLLFGLLSPLAAGARIVDDPASRPDRFHPHVVQDVVHRYGVTRLVTVPAHLRALLDAGARLPGVRDVVSSAAPLPAAWAKELESRAGVRVVDVLGSTESGGIATRRSACEEAWTPLPSVKVRVGTDARLSISSPFAPDPEEPLETGDRAFLLPDGTFRHLGRDDGVVKLGGRRFSLQELTVAALSLAGVRDAAALARPKTGSRGTELWLLVAGDDLERRALREELRERVDPILVPRRIRVLQSLPRDERGKLPKGRLERLLFTPGLDFVDLRLDPYQLTVRIAQDSRRFDGHFPGEPLLPAVAHLLDLIVPEAERELGAPVARVERLKWQHVVRPGDELVLWLTRPEAGAALRVRLELSSGEVVATGKFAAHGPRGDS